MEPQSPAPAPPWDPELAQYLAELQSLTPPDCLRPDTIIEVRAKLAEWPVPSISDLECRGKFRVSEVEALQEGESAAVPLLICRPAAAPDELLPAVYFIHGGGMVMGNNRLGLDHVLDIAEELRLGVVSVDYRLAPEFPHPVPIEDCYSGLQWVVSSGGDHGLDPLKIVVAGDSAGGGLAASLALLARDRGGPSLTGQILNAPMLDDRNNTFSSYQMAGLGIWDRVSNESGWRALLGEASGGPDVSPYAAAARAHDLSGLPLAYLEVGSAETFRDEVVAFASRIWACGGQAELHVWPGAFHGFFLDLPTAALSLAAREARVAWLRRLLASR
jgi:acetyl esterase/lipase